MSETKLTEEQRNKIGAITDEWEKEIIEMEQRIPPPDVPQFDGPRTWEFAKLARKYQSRIRKVYEE